MKMVTCCNFDGMLNFRSIMHLDDYLMDNEDTCVVLSDKIPYIDKDEGVLYMTFDEAERYINRGGRRINVILRQEF